MSDNPYQSPAAEVSSDETLVYAGFWVRVGAAIIDSIIVLAITWPILISIYGMEYLEGTEFIHGTWDFLLSWVFPIVAVVLFWIYKSATPGKMAVSVKLVDAKTGGKPSKGQCIGRYLGYYVSMLPLMLGIIWVAFDKKKQGWHDKLAGTLVVKK